VVTKKTFSSSLFLLLFHLLILLIVIIIQFTVGSVQEVVFPEHLKEANYIYPSPDWATRSCQAATNFCSGHGICTTVGTETEATCQCESQYYAGDVPNSCDAFCIDGEVHLDDFNVRYCRHAITFYIGGMLDLVDTDRLIHHAQFAVELINNKSDGWMDQNTAQVSLVMMLNNTACNKSMAISALEYQKAWAAANNNEKMISGIIGTEVIQ
jgi:hypothetical protein